jgi:hypothetical protein
MRMHADPLHTQSLASRTDRVLGMHLHVLQHVYVANAGAASREVEAS